MIAKISLSFITFVLCATNIAQAQTYQPSNRVPVADNTLGTQVTGTNNNFNINGGTTRGTSTFHSFQDFSVPTGGSATFTTGTGTQAIVTRVTGNLSSDINGTINTQGANFFLINPNGVVFGPNAQLNVGKAFVATTANSATLTDANGTAYTFGTSNPNDAPLLSINSNVGLNVSQLNFAGNNGEIVNYGTLRTGNLDQYIGLIGGNISLDAGSGGGNIVAPGGRVDLGGLSTAGTVKINSQGFVYDTTAATKLVRNDINIIDGARVDVTSTPARNNTVNTFFFNNATSSGSVINIDANNVRIFNRVPVPETGYREPIAQSSTGNDTSTTTIDDNALPRTRRISRLTNEPDQVVQACEEGDRKLTITGRGGIPTNANEILGSDVIWQDPRATSEVTTTPSNNSTAISKLPPPAIGWVTDDQGNVVLLGANSSGVPTGNPASCSSRQPS
jgi:filamentous hemagglutinin family protein